MTSGFSASFAGGLAPSSIHQLWYLILGCSMIPTLCMMAVSSGFRSPISKMRLVTSRITALIVALIAIDTLFYNQYQSSTKAICIALFDVSIVAERLINIIRRKYSAVPKEPWRGGLLLTIALSLPYSILIMVGVLGGDYTEVAHRNNSFIMMLLGIALFLVLSKRIYKNESQRDTAVPRMGRTTLRQNVLDIDIA